jgi:hypothetical protein
MQMPNFRALSRKQQPQKHGNGWPVEHCAKSSDVAVSEMKAKKEEKRQN